MPFMVFDKAKRTLQYFSNEELLAGPIQVKAVADGVSSFRAHNMASVNANANTGDTTLDSNGPWAAGSYALTWRQAPLTMTFNGQVETLWKDDVIQNGQLDPGETNYLDKSYSGRGYYRFGYDEKKPGLSNVDNYVPYVPVRDHDRDGDLIDSAVVGTTNWQMEFAAVGYRSGMDIHAGKAAVSNTDFYTAKGHATLGCIRVDDSTLAKLDQFHGLAAHKDGSSTASGLLIFNSVDYVSIKSTKGTSLDANHVALVDAREFGLAKASNVLSSGSGNDFLFGSHHQNELRGNSGEDRLFGKGGNDTLIGGDQTDLLYGGSGDDVLIGGRSKADNDTVFRDLIDGGLGNDKIYGAAGQDLLVGQQGNDTIVGNQGHDVIFGDYVTSFDRNGFGVTRSGFLPVTYQISDPGSPGQKKVISESWLKNLVAADGGWAPVSGTEEKIAKPFNNEGGNDSLFGGDGSDLIYGGMGADTIMGDAGDDVLVGNKGADSLKGGDGWDWLYGGEGSDTLEGGPGRDSYFWLTDQDVIVETTNPTESDSLFFRQSELTFSTRYVEHLVYIGVKKLKLAIDAPEFSVVSVGDYGSEVTIFSDIAEGIAAGMKFGAGVDILRIEKDLGDSFQAQNFQHGVDKIDLRALGITKIIGPNEDDNVGRNLVLHSDGAQVIDRDATDGIIVRLTIEFDRPFGAGDFII